VAVAWLQWMDEAGWTRRRDGPQCRPQRELRPGTPFLASRLVGVAPTRNGRPGRKRALCIRGSAHDKAGSDVVDDDSEIARRDRDQANRGALLDLAFNSCAQLVSGEHGVVSCLARTQEQSQVVLEYVAGIIEAAPILAKMVIRRAADSLTLFNRGPRRL
jgi:hypothetical protein